MGERSIQKKIDGYLFTISRKTGQIMGKPPSDPKKLKIYNAHNAAQLKKLHQGYAPNLAKGDMVQDDEPAIVVPQLSDKDILKRITNRFDVMGKIVRGAFEGSNHSVVVSGAPGVGKTFSIEKIGGEYVDSGSNKAEFVSGVVTPIEMYKLLFRNSEPNAVTILDDADQVFFEDQSLSILKGALDSKKTRKISWRSNSHALKGDDIPTEFIYEGAMIFITNIDFQSMLDAGRGRLIPHIDAIMNRAHYVDLMIHEPRHVFLWVEHQVKKHNILCNEHGIEKSEQDAVIEFIRAHQHRMRSLSIRSAIKIGSFVLSHPDEWEHMARETELKPE